MMKQSSNTVRRLAFAAMFLTLALVLPFLTGQIPAIGNALCPMHLPVLICGFVCGPLWGLAIGAVAPILRFLLFGMPPLFPTGIAMAFELATYGLIAGLLYRAFPKKLWATYLSLLIAMVAGRAVWGLVRFLIAGFQQTAFPFEAFLAGAVLNAIPGILLQILLIPPVIYALRKNRLMAEPSIK